MKIKRIYERASDLAIALYLTLLLPTMKIEYWTILPTDGIEIGSSSRTSQLQVGISSAL